tara:strand:- start:1137 stop:1895 length:759 start_codon:yes stop_codon:yes gene_type:complete
MPEQLGENFTMEGGASNISVTGFANHVFNFDSENKSNMMNMIQYITIGIIPIVVILKTIKYYIPEEDDNKSTPEITIEVALQLFAIFFAIWFIDKMIRYIPTYSGINYHKFNEINFILPILIILVTMQTKLGAKINILTERVMDLWNGNQSGYVGNSNHGNIKVSQPIVTPNIHQVSRADALDNTINPQAGQMQAQNNISMIDALPNMMQQNQNGGSGLTNFQNQAIQQSFMESMEPMAANGAIGGAFGSSF